MVSYIKEYQEFFASLEMLKVIMSVSTVDGSALKDAKLCQDAQQRKTLIYRGI